MYLKLTAINERFQVKFLNDSGDEVIPTSAVKTILYNKINSNYIPFLTETSLTSFSFSNKQITDRNNLYADIYLNEVPYKTKVKVAISNSEVILKYEINFESTYSVRDLSNKYLRRVSMGMPRWSTAYKNDISTFSKAFYPLYLIPEKILYKTNEVLNKSLRNEKHNKSVTIKHPLAIVKQGSTLIPKTYIKEKEVITSISQTPISQKAINLITFNQYTEFPVKLDKTFSHVFLKADKECFVIIKGISKDRKHISEILYCDGIVYSVSILKYKEVLDISYTRAADTEPVILEGTNFLSLQKYQNNFRKPHVISDSVSEAKDLEIPVYMYNENTQTVGTFYGKTFNNEGDSLDNYFIPEMLDNKGFFVTEDEDIIILGTPSIHTESSESIVTEDSVNILMEGNSSRLYVGLLRTSLEVDMPTYSSNNNNTVVTLLEGSVLEDSEVEFQITCKGLVEEFGNVSLHISIEVDGKIYYLSDNNEWVTEKVFKFLYNTNPIYISYDTFGINYISVVVAYNNVKYQASLVRNKIRVKGTDIVVDNLYHNGMDLISIRNKELSKLTLVKDYYEFNNDTSISYDNYNSNTTLLNVKGQLDGEYLN